MTENENYKLSTTKQFSILYAFIEFCQKLKLKTLCKKIVLMDYYFFLNFYKTTRNLVILN